MARRQDPFSRMRGVESSPIIDAWKDQQRGWSCERSVVLSGYLEKLEENQPGRENIWRLYRTLAFDECVEFDERDVLHVENVKRPGAALDKPTEPAIVWLKESARVIPIKEFLVGEIADLYMPHADLGAKLGQTGHPLATIVGNRSWAGCTNTSPCITPPH